MSMKNSISTIYGKLRIFIPVTAVLSILCITASAQTIHFASVAIKGTTPINIMEKLKAEVEELTGNKVKIRIHAGDQGDEPDIIRKMRRGRIHAAGFTGRGLGEILPEMRVMEVPFLFRNHDEVDYVVNKLYDRFAGAFEKEGYVLLGWAEAGFVYFFSNKKIESHRDLKGVRMWQWEGDPLAKAMFGALDLVPNPLSLIEVGTALQTGLIDAVYVPPFYAVALQWAQRTKYMSELQVTNAAGAIIMLKSKFDELSTEHREIVLSSSKKWLKVLVEETRKKNAEALDEIKQRGIEIVPAPNGDDLDYFLKTGLRVQNEMVDVLYPRELLDQVLALLEEYRSKR